MAFGALSNNGAGSNKAASTSVTNNLSATTASAGDLVIVRVALDNTSTVDAQTSEVSSITDSVGGNTWTKYGEFCNGQGGAGSGATVSVWGTVLANAMSAATITANLANSVTAKAMRITSCTIGAGVTISVNSLQTLANDGADPGNMTISGLSSAEYLFIRAIAVEDPGVSLTPTASYNDTGSTATSGGGAATNMGIHGEYRILTGTGDSSNPTVVAADSASVYFALKEVIPTVYIPYDISHTPYFQPIMAM